jgi:hypothetical protein
MYRKKAKVLDKVESVSVAEHESLRACGSEKSDFWNKHPDEIKPVLAKFKYEVKNYYLFAQGRRCCYCSFELPNDHAVFDAEHILDKSKHKNFMFELNNLAAACKPCNRGKSHTSPLIGAEIPTEVPSQSENYKIVHPHLDEWTDHLEFDDLNRIRAKGGSVKGQNTISLCNIDALNAARLSDHFAHEGGKAETLLRKFFEYTSPAWKRKCLHLLRDLVGNYGLSQASSIIDRLEQEMGEG